MKRIRQILDHKQRQPHMKEQHIKRYLLGIGLLMAFLLAVVSVPAAWMGDTQAVGVVQLSSDAQFLEESSSDKDSDKSDKDKDSSDKSDKSSDRESSDSDKDSSDKDSKSDEKNSDNDKSDKDTDSDKDASEDKDASDDKDAADEDKSDDKDADKPSIADLIDNAIEDVKEEIVDPDNNATVIEDQDDVDAGEITEPGEDEEIIEPGDEDAEVIDGEETEPTDEEEPAAEDEEVTDEEVVDEDKSNEEKTDEEVIDEENQEEVTEEELTEEELLEEEEKELEDISLEDEESGVTVTIPAASIPEDLDPELIGLVVRDLTDEEKETALTVLEVEEANIVMLMDISLINKETEEEIQPAGDVTVTIPEVSMEDGEVEVQRINDDETVTTLEGNIEEEVVTFDTEHFTPYAVTVSSGSLQALKNAIANAPAGDIEITLTGDVTWDLSGVNNYLEIPAGKYVTIKGNNYTLKRGNNCVGTMIHVRQNASLTLENVTMNGNGHEFIGNGDYGWNGINGHIKGIFIYNEGELNLGSGAVLKNGHTKTNYAVGEDGNKHKGDTVSPFVAPIVAQGGVVNLYEGSQIVDNYLTAKVYEGGNAYSAGAILALPACWDNANFKKSTINMYGGTIARNKVGFDWNQSKDDYIQNYSNRDTANAIQDKDLYRQTNDFINNAWVDDSEITSARTGDNVNSFKRTYASSNKTTVAADHGYIMKRTAGAGAILLISSNMNMEGGTITQNNGEVGGIGVNGVSNTFVDLFVAEDDTAAKGKYNQSDFLVPEYRGKNEDGSYKDPSHIQWTGSVNDRGLGLKSDPPSTTKIWSDGTEEMASTLNFTGGTISKNRGVSNGGVYVGRYGIMKMGTEDGKAKPLIDNNRSWANYGGGGIGLNSQWDNEDHTLSEGSTNPKDSEAAMPEFYMYSGTISNNHSSNKGGGIYVATDNAHIYGGKILNNKGDSHGGGMYVEMKYLMTFESITEVKNNKALSSIAGSWSESQITEMNSASSAAAAEKLEYDKGYNWGYDGFGRGDSGIGAGGGLWMCPEGQSTFDSLGTLIVHDNYAEEAGDDVYKVVVTSLAENTTSVMNMPNLDPVGGKVLWFRDGGFKDRDANSFRNATSTWLVNGVDGKYPNFTAAYVDNRNPYHQNRESYNRFGQEFGVEQLFEKQINPFDAFAVKSVYNSETLKMTEDLGLIKIEISGNQSARGGGIGGDGRFTFGGETVTQTHNLEIEKGWPEGSLDHDVMIRVYAENSAKTAKTLVGSMLITKDEQTGEYHGSLKNLPSTVLVRDPNTGLTEEVEIFRYTSSSAEEAVPTEHLVLMEAVKYRKTYTDTNGIERTFESGDAFMASPIFNDTSEDVYAGEAGSGYGAFDYYDEDGNKISSSADITSKIRFTGRTNTSLDEQLDGPNGTFVKTQYEYVYETNISNNPSRGSIKLVKVDSADSTVLEGAEFDLYRADNDEVLAHGVTDKNGVLEFTGLYYGDYYLVETKAPDGYVLSDKRIPVTVTGKGIVVYEQTEDAATEYNVASKGNHHVVTYVDASGNKQNAADWSFCINGKLSRPGEHTTPELYKRVTDVDYETVKKRVEEQFDIKNLTKITFDKEDYMKLKRVLYWYATEGSKYTNSFDETQYVIRTLTDNGSDTYVIKATHDAIIEARDNKDPVTDDYINSHLILTMYEQVTGVDKTTGEVEKKQYQNMITAKLVTDAPVVESVTVTNDKTTVGGLPNTGSKGFTQYLIYALLLIGLGGAYGVGRYGYKNIRKRFE